MSFASQRTLDLTHTLRKGISVYPGTPPPGLEAIATVETDGFAEMRLTLTTHMGTHIDAPAHMIAGGKTLDQYPAGHFVGRALVIDCRQLENHEISQEQLNAWEAAIDAADFVLLCTGWADKWGTDAYLTGYPVLTEPAAQWLVTKSLKGIGLDTISPDHLHSTHYPIHHLLFQRELVIIENLTNLHLLTGQTCTLLCLPIRIAQADAAPARAIAILGQ